MHVQRERDADPGKRHVRQGIAGQGHAAHDRKAADEPTATAIATESTRASVVMHVIVQWRAVHFVE
jgi:hypothetical protein